MSSKNIDKDYALKILMAGINVEDKESLKQGLQELIGSSSSGEGVDWNENDETSPEFVKNRPFYDKSLVSVPYPEATGIAFYKVSDDVPTGHHAEKDNACIILDGIKMNSYIAVSHDECYAASELAVVVALKDNVVFSEFNNLTFPEKGTYFVAGEGYPSITGFALGIDADPEITWNGDTGEIKPIDEKFIPEMSNVILKSSTADSTKKFKITVDDSGTISATEVTG